MTTMDAPRSIFGQITLEDMRQNELLTKTVLPLIQKACVFSDGRYTIGSVTDGIMAGRFDVWGVMAPPANLQAVAVTHAEAYGEGRAYQILLLGSPDFDDLTRFFDFLPMLEKVAHAARCDRMVIVGRKSWERILPDGWRTAATLYERQIVSRDA